MFTGVDFVKTKLSKDSVRCDIVFAAEAKLKTPINRKKDRDVKIKGAIKDRQNHYTKINQ